MTSPYLPQSPLIYLHWDEWRGTVLYKWIRLGCGMEFLHWSVPIYSRLHLYMRRAWQGKKTFNRLMFAFRHCTTYEVWNLSILKTSPVMYDFWTGIVPLSNWWEEEVSIYLAVCICEIDMIFLMIYGSSLHLLSERNTKLVCGVMTFTKRREIRKCSVVISSWWIELYYISICVGFDDYIFADIVH